MLPVEFRVSEEEVEEAFDLDLASVLSLETIVRNREVEGKEREVEEVRHSDEGRGREGYGESDREAMVAD